jgi:hypothetical protein
LGTDEESKESLRIYIIKEWWDISASSRSKTIWRYLISSYL